MYVFVGPATLPYACCRHFWRVSYNILIFYRYSYNNCKDVLRIRLLHLVKMNSVALIDKKKEVTLHKEGSGLMFVNAA